MPKTRWHRALSHNVLSTLLSSILLALPAAAAEFRLTINGVRSENGEILIALYDNEAGFLSAIANAETRGLIPETGRLIGTAIRAQRGSQSTVFTQLPPGRYAVIVIHDENDNGRLDKSVWGVPIEGYGFGNDAQGFLGAPSFDAAAIAIGDADVSTSISLNYPKGFSPQDQSDYDQLIGRPSSQENH
jgi:uncharacterized protein (DUF2141 family)